MDRDWMWLPNRLSRDYVEGVKSFIQVAKEHLRWDNKTRCPCRDCQNARFNDLLTIERHLIRFGFSRSYQNGFFMGKNMNLNLMSKMILVLIQKLLTLLMLISLMKLWMH